MVGRAGLVWSLPPILAMISPEKDNKKRELNNNHLVYTVQKLKFNAKLDAREKCALVQVQGCLICMLNVSPEPQR